MIIKNAKELASHGNKDGRRAVLEILEAGLRAADPYENVKKLIRVEEGKLIVGYEESGPTRLPYLHAENRSRVENRVPLVFDLSQVGNIYVVGGGKAAQRQAKAIEDALGDLITEGHVNAKKGDRVYLERIEVTLAGHPIPDEDSVEGARRILEIERKARKGDIVFLSESGGGSALLTLPAPGLTLEELQEVNRVLYFECGATMWDTNAVRNQLVLLRGRHARHVGDATLVQISTDERPPGLRIRVDKQQSCADSYRHAISVLERYHCWDKVPQSVRAFLERADPEYGMLRPEEWDERPRYYFRVMGPEYMLEAAKEKAEEMGLNSQIVVSSLSDVEARPASETFAYMAQEIEVNARPFGPPCVLLCGGEVIVTVGDNGGVGGRNQEFALSAAPRIDGSENVVVASVNSDGTDGPTDMAGGIVDGYTMNRALEKGINVFEELDRHNSGVVLNRLDDAIFTGVQGTNVQDLRVVFVGRES
jgi:glycerate-2-kinase